MLQFYELGNLLLLELLGWFYLTNTGGSLSYENDLSCCYILAENGADSGKEGLDEEVRWQEKI